MKKCFFFDADGTILDIKKGVAKDFPEALNRLLAAGHSVFLCTGRSRALVPSELEHLPFTGIIANLGAYIEYEGKPIYAKELSFADAKRALTVLRTNGLVPVMEGNTHMYYDLDEYTTDVDWYADLITNQLGSRLLPISGNEDALRINKISAKMRPGCDVTKACSALSDIFDFIHHEGAFVGSTVECIAKGHSKGLAIAVLSTVLGFSKEDIVAFGDSNNDLSMFQVAGTKIAMGDASKELAEAATYVTETMGNGGITQALAYLRLI